MNKQKFYLALGLILFYMIGGPLIGRYMPSIGDFLDQGLSYSLLLFFGILVAAIVLTKSWRFVGLVGRDKVPAVRWIVVLFVVQLVILLLYTLLCATDYTSTTGRLVFVLANVALVAFNEEVLFRGFLYGSVEGWGPVQRILFVSALFGLFHLGNLISGDPLPGVIVQVVMVGIASILDAVIRYGTGSLWPTIAIHFLWDAGGLLGQGKTADALGPIIQALTVIAGLVSLAVIARAQYRRKDPQPVPTTAA